ncbi:arylsulfatase [Algoriphagus sediminis]|uniref:Arylsulfatase n=1 Tax=Algoriphagus sediminis TaxID=3057113 RepID=A0ABT7YBL8_9BACT|nr:arylsulfatase [Algoriphagus sediminis]MDN3203903.1 arylsulfatase [Algoriphagus sediminis]
MKSLLYLLLAFVLFACSKKSEEKPPNVILILTDDQGYGDLGVHGNDKIRTPNLDVLAHESVRFDRFYVSPLCAPTRASLLTGRYHLRTGTVTVSNGLETMDAEEYTLAELFKDNGYSTGIFGKWHNGQHYPHHPLAQGFDEFVGFLGGHWTNYFNTTLEIDQKNQNLPGYLPDVLTDKAIDFMERNEKTPFFLYLPYNTPHSPHQVPDEYFDSYKSEGLDDELAAIHGMVENIDSNVGRVLKKLEDMGLDQNTLVIFLTDNGPNGVRFNDNMKGRKGSVNEGGVRVPSFWRWKGKFEPRIVTAASAHIDVFPTLVDLLGLENNGIRTIDGISLKPLLLGNDLEIERPIFSQVAQPQSELTYYPGAIREDQMLLVLNENGEELFDMSNDPNQKKDLADEKPEILEAMKAKYDKWWDEVTAEIQMERPIPISDQSPQILLPGYEARFTEGISFFEGHGWAQDWLTQWKSMEDSIYWDLNVLDRGEFEVWLSYTAEKNQVPSALLLYGTISEIEIEINEPFQGEIIPSINRIPRKEAPEQTWRKINIGMLEFEEGRQNLVLKALSMPSNGVGDFYSLELIPKE